MARTHKILTVLLLSAAPAAASPGAAAPAHPAPPPDAQAPPALRELRDALITAGRDAALAALPRFRPLCDKDGYPLVGNLAVKGDIYQPSQFCSELRTRAVKR